MKKILLVLSLFFLSTSIAFAQTTTPVATSSGSTSNPSLDEIQKIRQVVQEKVKEKLKQISNPIAPDTNSPKSLMGTISKINGKQITINSNGNNKVINVADDTVFIDNKKNKTKLEKITVGQDILVLGYYDASNVMGAKRIIVVDIKSLENLNQVVVGKIVDISKSSPVFVLIPNNNKNTQYQVKTDSKSVYIDKNNKTLDIKNLSSGQKIIVIIKPDAELSKTFYASKIISLVSPASSPTPANSSTSAAKKK